MESNRRDFLKGTAWMGLAAAVGGCATLRDKFGGCGAMSGYAAKPLSKIRVGIVGLGQRGSAAVGRLASIPGVEVAALCDLYRDRVAVLAGGLKKPPRQYFVYDAVGEAGKDETAAYKAMCESELDLIYVTSPWATHTPIGLYAMENGKHVAIEVPAAMTVEDCWALVKTSERTGLHCMQLENCCYDDFEMATLNMVRQGALGELLHGEGAYLHDLRELSFKPFLLKDTINTGYQGYWRLKWNSVHGGNPYPTHGLLPVMQCMNINRGDRLDYLTCVESAAKSFDLYAAAKFGGDSWQANVHPRCGDMSTTVIRTVKGRTIMVQHNVASAQPYSRIHLLMGTRGVVRKWPQPMVALANNDVEGAHNETIGAAAEAVVRKYQHPLWKTAGELARRMGGHGGMDFLMDLRLCYCLQNGLPLDMDVYDLAASCAVCELSERSARNRGDSQDVPDFTGGKWETAKPLGIVTVDLDRIGKVDAANAGHQLEI